MLLSFRIGREETLFLCESIILKMNSCLKKYRFIKYLYVMNKYLLYIVLIIALSVSIVCKFYQFFKSNKLLSSNIFIMMLNLSFL